MEDVIDPAHGIRNRFGVADVTDVETSPGIVEPAAHVVLLGLVARENPDLG